MCEVLAELHAVREKLYDTRWSTTSIYADKKRDVLV
jgi:hypothetical protein